MPTVRLFTPGHGRIMDTLICHALAHLLGSEEGKVIPLDERYVIELREEPDWENVSSELVEELEDALEDFEKINFLRSQLGEHSERKEEIKEPLRALKAKPGGRLWSALRTQGGANVKAAIRSIKEAIQEITSGTNIDLGEVYSIDHAQRYGEGRGGMSGALRRTHSARGESVRLYTAPLPVIGYTGKYAPGLYGYSPQQEKVCAWDLLLSWLGIARSSAVITEGREETAISIILLRPAKEIGVGEVRLASQLATTKFVANPIPLSAAVLVGLSGVSGVRDPGYEKSLEKISAARWGALSYRFELQSPSKPYAIRRTAEYPAFRLLSFIKLARANGVPLPRLIDELIGGGDVDIVGKLAESVIYGDLDGFADSVRAAWSALSSRKPGMSQLVREGLVHAGLKVCS